MCAFVTRVATGEDFSEEEGFLPTVFDPPCSGSEDDREVIIAASVQKKK